MTEWIGKTIGNVQIEGLLNRGGLTEVYTGTHLILQRPVVIKLLYSYLEENPAVLEKFHRVAEAVVGLRHPHIVQVFEFDTTDGHPFMVTDYVKGPTLTTYLQNLQRRKKRMATDQVAGLLKGLAAALDYAHAQGLVHRDIKPGNILLHNDGKEIPLDRPLAEDVEAILTDFGLVDVLAAHIQQATPDFERREIHCFCVEKLEGGRSYLGRVEKSTRTRIVSVRC